MVQLGAQDAGDAYVLDAGGQVLAQGAVDCQVEPDHPQCEQVRIVRGEGEHGLARPLSVVAFAGGLRVAFNPADYPPPLVMVDGVVVNR
jgi:hypothetical protein